jgi:hypothetical protein
MAIMLISTTRKQVQVLGNLGPLMLTVVMLAAKAVVAILVMLMGMLLVLLLLGMEAGALVRLYLTRTRVYMTWMSLVYQRELQRQRRLPKRRRRLDLQVV